MQKLLNHQLNLKIIKYISKYVENPKKNILNVAKKSKTINYLLDLMIIHVPVHP